MVGSYWLMDRETAAVVNWATRMVALQAGVSVDAAWTLLATTAAAADAPVEVVAKLVVNGTVEFGEHRPSALAQYIAAHLRRNDDGPQTKSA
ncbi:MAG: hypothetical protein ACLPVY_10615 [Acidimicrobiia bacterium]